MDRRKAIKNIVAGAVATVASKEVVGAVATVASKEVVGAEVDLSTPGLSDYTDAELGRAHRICKFAGSTLRAGVHVAEVDVEPIDLSPDGEIFCVRTEKLNRVNPVIAKISERRGELITKEYIEYPDVEINTHIPIRPIETLEERIEAQKSYYFSLLMDLASKELGFSYVIGRG